MILNYSGLRVKRSQKWNRRDQDRNKTNKNVNKNVKPQKAFSDKDGRYMAVEIGGKILVVNIYAPNGTKKIFFEELQRPLNATQYKRLIES